MRMGSGVVSRGLIALLWVTTIAQPAHSLTLGPQQNIELRGRFYSRAALRLENSDSPPGADTVPRTYAGQLVEHRNFYHPELEANLTPYLPDWLDPFRPDEASVRATAWGFYDGIYDYGARQFGDRIGEINRGWPNLPRENAFFLQGSRFVGSASGVRPGQGGAVENIFPGAKVVDARRIYSNRHRLNELYLNLSKGPLFLRIGKQAISWGESDTIAILDQNNPYDLLLGVPGLFQEIEEARIPLWTLRSTLRLFDSLGPFSSGFVEAYWVPGGIDTNTGWLPVLTASPYSAPGRDPQQTLREQLGDLYDSANVQFVLQDVTPRRRTGSSRWGVRGQTVAAGHTLSAWVYTTFPNTASALSQGLVRTNTPTSLFLTQTIHNDLVTVVGLSDSFYLEAVDSIVRTELEFFNQEPGFVPELNLGINEETVTNPLGVLRNCSNGRCRVPKADFLRWELGFDKFFFVRPLNPTNSFLAVLAIVGSWNMDEGKRGLDPILTVDTGEKDENGRPIRAPKPRKLDFRYYGQRRPGAVGTSPNDFVQLNEVEAFAQLHLETNYLHGRLTPGITLIANLRGTTAVNPTLAYRINDTTLLDMSLILIDGAYQQMGFFRDRDQLAMRLTYQIN